MWTRGRRTRVSLSWMLADDMRSRLLGTWMARTGWAARHGRDGPRGGRIGRACLLLLRLGRLDAHLLEDVLARGFVRDQFREEFGERELAPMYDLLQRIGHDRLRLRPSEIL